ncbi:MAG: hypothetical protein AB4372_32710 [Xenococcus sp. (in: cyanobacteria)]
MTQIICLANSWKYGERCIAGINIHTKKWVRPIYTNSNHSENGSVPENIRLIDGQEPKLLDIISMPLDKEGDNFGFQSENVNILPGKWRKLGKVKSHQMVNLCDQADYILHNTNRYVTVPFLQSLPVNERKTLQLIYTEELSIINYRHKWKGSCTTNHQGTLTEATITDPEFVNKLEFGYLPQNPCLVTVSLSMPFIPCADWNTEDPCWKLIAGVIELF